MVATCSSFFADIEDFRRPPGKKFELRPILLLSVIAILCNTKSYRDINRFIKGKFTEIKESYQLGGEKHRPTNDSKYYQRYRCRKIGGSIPEFMQSQTRYGFNDEVIHITVDDKVLRHSFDNFEDNKALQKLKLFDSDNYMILGHIDIDEKSNEIPAFQSLLSQL